MPKIAKTRKVTKFRPPDDQLQLKTECGHCGDVLPDPSTAQHHLATEHSGEFL